MQEGKYKYGFTTEVESEQLPAGLNEETIIAISQKKDEQQWLLDWRLKAYERWLTRTEPAHWAKISYPRNNYQGIWIQEILHHLAF